MKTARGCGWVALALMFVLVACLIFASLAAGLFLTGELTVYEPRLTHLEPDPNAAFLPSTPITLTFDQPMNTASVEGAFVLEPDVPGTFRWSEDFSQVAFVPEGAGFEPGTSYSARLEAGAKAGTFPRTTARSVQWSFSLPPLLDTVEPPPGAEGLGPQPVLTATFNYNLDCPTTLMTFTIDPDTPGLPACKDTTVTFNPTQPLEAGTRYVAALAHLFLEGDPTPRPGVQWEFRTAPPLVVEQVLPAEAGFLTDLWSPFTVAFSRPVEPESAISRFSLGVVGGVPVAGDFSWQQDGAVLVFQPKEPLKPDMQYEAVVASGVRDLLGYKLEESRRASYATPPMLDLPVPISGTLEVALDSTIRVPFARPMDKESVEAGLVVSPSLEGELVWEEDTLVFIPRRGFSPETEYQVMVREDVRDATGAPLARSHQWTFKTEPFLIEAQVPSETTVTQLRQPLQFTFALPMDRASVHSALTISPTTPGDLSWSDGDRMVTFQPDPAWLPGAEYEVTLAGSARTANGLQTLSDEVGYAFTTGVADVRFGEGPNVQVVATEGERVFQVVARGADVADFRMFALSLAQFLELYHSEPGAAGVQPSELEATIPVTPTVSWREPLSAWGSEAGGQWQPAEAHIPADVLPGLYVLSAEPSSEVQGQLLVVLSDHLLVVKKALAGSGSLGRAQIVAWDTTIDDGSPVVSATLRVYAGDGAVVAEGATGGDGLVEMSVPGEPVPSLVVSESAGDVTVAGLEPEWSALDGSPAGSPESRPGYLIYAFTDQAVYRPAGTIHFKMLVRADDDVQYRLPAPDLPITVRLRDVRGNLAASQVFTATEFGTVYGSFEITDQPLVGLWSLEAEVEGTLTRTPLQVVGPQEARSGDAGRIVQGAEQGWSADLSDLALWQAASSSEDPQLSVEVDRQELAAGQEAQIVISTPVSGTALLSLERGTVHHIEAVSLVSGTNPISLAVQADYAPNVELAVSQFGPSAAAAEDKETRPDLELHTARAQLLVPMEDKLLTVSLRADQDSYNPGDEAVVSVEVNDHQDQPVVAEVSLALVDGATYALSDGQPPEPFEVFYGPQPNAVRTYDSMRPTRWLAPDEPRPPRLPPVAEEEGSALPATALDSPFWAPAVLTDARGQAEVTIQLPDDPADWMVVARAITTDTQIGEATTQLVITRGVTIWPEVPGVLVHGDTFSLTVGVQNPTSQPVSVTIQLEQEGLQVRSEGSQLLHLPAGGTASALWPAVAERPGQAQITLRATASRGTRLVGRDVADVSLRIEPLTLSETRTWAGALTPDHPAETITLTVPAGTATSASQLEISLAPSVVPALVEGLVFLVDYPYDCVEQTLSEVVATASVVEVLEGTTGSPALEGIDPLPTVQLGLQKLYGYQHEDGGWSWWQSGGSDAYQTAYVLQGLAIAGQAGFAVDEGVVERGVEAILPMLADADSQMQAYGAYALAMAGHPPTLTLTVTDALQLDPFSQAALAIAIDVAGEGARALDPTQEMGPALFASLEASAIEGDTTAHWEEAGQGASSARAAMGSPVRTTALVALALVRLDPENDLLPKAVHWLMGQRQGLGWGDTQRTSYAILALTGYARAAEPEAASPEFQLLLNGELWEGGQIDPLQGQVVLTAPVSLLAPGDNELQVVLGSEGAVPSGLLYYAVTASSELVPTEGSFAAAQGREPGTGVLREYRLPGSEEPATEFQPGDLVEVVITADVPEESWYVVVEDALPAGFELLDQHEGAGTLEAQAGGPESTGPASDYAHMEVRANRIAFFFEHLETGLHSWSYLVRAVTPGSFSALPVTVYPMYEPEAWSRSASSGCIIGAH